MSPIRSRCVWEERGRERQRQKKRHEACSQLALALAPPPQHALDLVRAAEAAADAAGVLPAPGSGETAEDIPASDLRFALLPAWAGDLLAVRAAGAGVVVRGGGGDGGSQGRGPGGAAPAPPLPSVDPAARAAALGAASSEHRRFLAGVRLLGLLPSEARHALVGLGGGGEGEEEEEAGDGGITTAPTPDPAALRAAKVAAFRARKALAAQAAELGARLAAAGDSVSDPADAHAAACVEVRLAALGAAEAVTGADAEAALLRAASRLPPSARVAAVADRSAAGPPADVVSALRAAADGLAGRGGGRASAAADTRPCFTPASAGGPSPAAPPSAIASSHADRTRLAAEVFRPSHILPTKTLAAQADEEVAAAMARSAASDAAAARAAAAKEAAGSDSDGLEADGGPNLVAARRMDDWKDDHPRGYGNSKLRPAAL